MVQLLKDVFAVDVPEDFIHGELVIINDTVLLKLTAMNLSTTTHSEIALPPGSYEILFTTKDCNEEQAAGMVELHSVFKGHWRAYDEESECYMYDDATESLQSLLRSKNLSTDRNYLLLKKI